MLDKWVDDFIIGTIMRPVLDFDENNMSHEFRIVSWRAATLAYASKSISYKDLNDWPKWL